MSESDKESTSPQDIATAQVCAIRDALYVLGEPTTLERLSELVDLPLDVLKRRLNANGPGAYRPEWQRFKFDKNTRLWSLTALGHREAEMEANKR